ncbi:MAG TPA: hypothetical protein VGN80_19090 [Devosiaceae bacterium]|jgi:hypothetical protein|nr:hypothetical protein [Devosiaceae bacterium]
MAWGLFRAGAHRVRVTSMGQVVGVETDAILRRLEAAGIDTETADVLVAACERGFLLAMSEKEGGPEA